jgi:serine/threonine protein kinase/ribosomal protein L32
MASYSGDALDPMTYSSACPKCGETLYRDDVHCPRCGTRREESVLASTPARGATRALAATSAAGQGEIPTCPSCGAPRLAGDVFCASCGTPVPDEPTPIPGTGQSPTPGEPAPPPGDPVPPFPAAGDVPTPPSETAPDSEEAFDGWQEVRLQLEEATRGEFEVVRELGRGGMAAVYLARDLALGRNVAIKVMAPGLLMGPGMVDRFRQEAVTVANLHHPNIVTIHTVRQAGSLHFFVMQVVEGGSLEDILARPDPIPVYLVQAILYQLGVGLSYAHRRGVIHRDIKPANVLLDQDGNAILTDFGIAKVTTASNLTQTGSTIGTPAYMSPEQCMAKELSGASDQYSLGVVAYEMLTGRPPFSGSPFEIMQAHTSAVLPGIREQRPDCPPEMEAAVLRMLSKDPGDRFADVAEAIEAIGGYLPGPQDPLRGELARLVTQGAGASPSDRTPLKPTPGRASTPAPPSKAAPSRIAQSLRSRFPLWVTGIVAAATLVTVGLLSLWPSSQEGTEPVAPQPLPISSIRFANPREEVLVGVGVRITASLEDAGGNALSGESVEWISDNPSVATVEGSNEDVVVTGVATGTATVLARAGNVEGSFDVIVSAPAAGELSVSAPGRELMVGAQMDLSAILTDETGAQVPDPDLTWSSSDPRVLDVDPRTGTARGRGLGRAQVTATSGNRTGTVSLSVVGRVDGLTVNPPSGALQAGGRAVLRATVTSRPAGYLGAGGVRWSSSNPSVASVSSSAADSAVVTLLGPGETVLTARADAVQGAVTLQVEARPAAATVSLSAASVTFQAVEGTGSPEEQTVTVGVTGAVTPTLGVIQYGAGASGWLGASLGAGTGQETVLTLRADAAGLRQGSYTAGVPVGAGGDSRVVNVSLIVAASPAATPIEPTAAAAQDIANLLADYAAAINSKNTGRVREIFPSLPQDAIDDLLGLRDTDTYLLQLVPGSLRLGSRDRTLEGDVFSSVLGRENRGEAVRMIYAFGRGERGWYIVSVRTGSQEPRDREALSRHLRRPLQHLPPWEVEGPFPTSRPDSNQFTTRNTLRSFGSTDSSPDRSAVILT